MEASYLGCSSTVTRLVDFAFNHIGSVVSGIDFRGSQKSIFPFAFLYRTALPLFLHFTNDGDTALSSFLNFLDSLGQELSGNFPVLGPRPSSLYFDDRSCRQVLKLDS